MEASTVAKLPFQFLTKKFLSHCVVLDLTVRNPENVPQHQHTSAISKLSKTEK